MYIHTGVCIYILSHRHTHTHTRTRTHTNTHELWQPQWSVAGIPNKGRLSPMSEQGFYFRTAQGNKENHKLTKATSTMGKRGGGSPARPVLVSGTNVAPGVLQLFLGESIPHVRAKACRSRLCVSLPWLPCARPLILLCRRLPPGDLNPHDCLCLLDWWAVTAVLKGMYLPWTTAITLPRCVHLNQTQCAQPETYVPTAKPILPNQFCFRLRCPFQTTHFADYTQFSISCKLFLNSLSWCSHRTHCQSHF